MADLVLASDSRTAAVTAAATKWLHVSLSLVSFAISDQRATAIARTLSLVTAEALINSRVWSASTPIYKMRGMDAVTTAHDCWLVSGVPDFAGTRYAGALATPLRDIVIVDSWPG